MSLIYLDYAATTPVDPQVFSVMQPYLTDPLYSGNPASVTHEFGWRAHEAVEVAREQVASALGADTREIVWTSGATESINLALQGAVTTSGGKHIVTTKSEHKAVLDTCQYLESQGVAITYLQPDAQGLIAVEQLDAAITEDTFLCSLLWVNNETGVMQDIEALTACAKARGVLVHVDAVQAVGKVPIDLSTLPIDLLSLSAHKVYGPKGAGALFVRRRGQPKVRIKPLLHGGGHEKGRRSGTLATHQIIGLAEAVGLAVAKRSEDMQHCADLKSLLWAQLQLLPSVSVNGSLQHSAPHILNVRFDGVDGEALMTAIQGVAVSMGSACTSASMMPSHVLHAMGLTDQQAHSSVRFSFGRMTTEAEVNAAAERVVAEVTKLRNMSPLWGG